MDKKHSGPKRSVTTPENVQRVREALVRSPERSARRHANELRINRESVRRILRKELKFHSYKMLIVQQLKATDFAARKDFAYRMQVILGSNENVTLLMSDEAHFHLNGTVDKQKPTLLGSRASTHYPPASLNAKKSKSGVLLALDLLLDLTFSKRTGPQLLLIRFDTGVCLKRSRNQN